MSVISFLITILGVVFWVFRLAVCMFETLEIDFICKSINLTYEIGIIFLTIPCFIFVFKRNIIGAACYLALYVSFYGTALVNTLNKLDPEKNLYLAGNINTVSAIAGIGIVVLTFIDILINKNRRAIVGGHRETDWYYNNEKYDREFDERADRNQYKIR